MSHVTPSHYQYIYVLRSQTTNRFYTGSTSDSRKRFIQHQSNQVVSTKNHGPYDLVYYEACINKLDAYAREKYLKSGMGKRYLKNRLKRFLGVTR